MQQKDHPGYLKLDEKSLFSFLIQGAYLCPEQLVSSRCESHIGCGICFCFFFSPGVGREYPQTLRH